MSIRNVSVIETNPVNKFKYCLIGVPDVGLVGSIASSYIIQETQMDEVGYLESDAFPPIIVIHKGVPKSPIRLYYKNDIIVMISEIPIEHQSIPFVVRSIIDWVKSKNCELLISLSGISVQNRLDIDVPSVYGVGSSSSLKKIIENANIKIFEEGFLVGLHSSVMKECLKKGVSNIILLAQSHLKYPDPGAAASLITSINKLFDLNIDNKKLLTEEEDVRLKLRELMQRTEQQMQKAQKGQEQEIPPLYV